MTDKKKDILRIIIFIVLANLPMLIGGIFFESESKVYSLMSYIAPYSPAIAHIITRIITKDKAPMYLRINFKGNKKYYLMGIVYALITSVLEVVAVMAVASGNEITLNFGKREFAFLLFLIALGIVGFYILIGEEFGWRAYLTPKLEGLMPEPLALIVSGIVWGMWHAVPITNGLNFGFGYWGEPYTGFLVMCISCIFYGSMLTYLTKKTKSIYPASICHSGVDVIRTISVIVGDNPEFAEILEKDSFKYCVFAMIPDILIGAVFFVILTREYIKHNNKCHSEN